MTEKDVKDLLFTQVRKVQVGPPVDCSSRRVSLLVVSNKYGLTVVGCNDGLRVFKTAVLNDIASKDEFKKTTAPESALKATFVRLPSSPLILSLSSNETILSVCLSDCVSPKAAFTVLIYNIVQLAQGKTSPLCSFEPQKTTTDHVAVVGAQWNPSTVPSLLALCLSSGDVLLVDVVDSSARVTRSSPIGATSLCWSPKGKQLAVGLKNGRVAQLGQDLSKKKEFGCPDIFRDEEQVANLFWISTREFAVMYSPLDAPSASSGLPPITTCVILLTHANGSTGFNPVNFDDVHCGTGFNVYNFLFNFIPNWKLLMIGSSSAIEVAVLSQTNNEWEKWNLEGTARPEVPLCAKTNDDCYVAGMALDFTSTAPVQLSDELSLPPCPLLLIYSTEGIIMPYTIVNTSCSPDKINELSIHPEPLPAPPQTTSPTQPLTRGLAMSPTATSVAPMSTQPRPVPPQTALAMSKPATQGLLSSLHPTNPASVSTSGSTAPSPFAGGSLGFSVSSFLTKPSVGAASQPASAVQASITAGKPGIASSTTNAQSPLSLLPKVTPQPASSLAPALLKSPSAEGGGLSLSTIQKPQDSIATAANLPPQMSPITILPLSSTPLTQQPSLQQAQRTSQQQVQQQQQQVQQQQQQVQLQMMQRQQQQHMQQQQVQQQMMQRQQQQQQVQQQMIQQQQQQQVHQQQQVQLQMMQRQQQMQQQQQIQQQHIQRQQQIQQQQSGAHSVSAVSKPPLTTNSPTTIPTKPPPLTTTTSSAAPVTQQQARPTAAAAAPLPSHVQEKFDASFTNLIEQEIEKFVIDMNELTEDAVDKLNLPQDAEEERMRIIPQLGSMEDAMGTLVKGLDDLKETAMQIIDQTKELEGRVGAVGDKVLKGFELSEGSRIRLQKTTDTKHLMLLRLQPLDPHNTRRLNDIRNHFTQLEQKLREVNCQLDAELEFRHESIRQFGRSPMKPPPLQTVYSTLRNHRQITRVQRKSIEQLTDQMKSLQLLPRLWQPEHSCDLPAQSPPRSVSFTTPGYRSMMEPPSPEETERQREKNKKLKEQLLRIQRPTEILVPQGPPMMTYSLLPAASSFSPSLASSPGPGSSILPPPPPPPSSLSQQQSLPQTSTILSSLTQPLPPPPVSSLLTRVSGTASQPPSLSSIRPQLQPLSTSQPTSSLTQPPSLIARPPGSQPLSQSIVWPPGPQPLSQIVRPPGPQPLSQIVRLPGSQPLSQIVRPPGPQTLSQPIVRPPGSQTLSHRPPGSQPLSQPIVWLPGSQPLSQPIFRPPASQPSLSSFPQPPPPTAQPLTASKPPVPPVGILPTSRPSAASPLGISLTTAPHKDHTAAILTSTELHIPQGDQSLIFNLSKGNIGNSAVSPSSVSSSLSLGPSRTFSLATSLPPTSSIVPSAPSPPTTPSTSPSSSSPPSSGPPPPSDLFSLQGQRVPPSFASAAKPPPSPWPSYTSLQNTPPLQNLPRPPYSPMLSVAGSVGKNDTSEPPLPTTASEVLPSSSSSPHSASPNVVITKSDISLSQRLAISQSFSSGQSLPASLTMMPQTMPKPSVGLTQSTTSTMTTTTSLSLFSGLLGSSASASGPSFVFGSNPNTGGPKQPFTFASPSSVVSSQLLPNADSKKDGSSSAALSLGDGKNPVTTTPSVSFPIPVSTVQVPTTVTSTVTPTTASQTGMMTPPQDQPKNGNDLKNKTDHKESTPTSSDLPKLTDSLSTALNGGGKTSQINNPSSSLMQDEKPLPTSSVAVISQQAPSVTKTTESDTVTSSTVNVAKTLHSLTTQQSTGSDEEMENESDEHDVPGTGAQGVFGLGKGGLGGLGLGGPNPMTGTSTANPFGSIGPVTPASLPTGSSTSSLFQAPRGPLMSSSLRMPPPSSGTGLGLLGASGFGVSPVFGSGSPMFGSGPGLSQQRPPQVSMANTSQRLLFSGSNEGGAAAAGPTGLFTNQQSGPSFSALASSNGAGSTGFGQLAAGNTQLAAGSTQPFTMSGSQFQSYR